MRISTVSALLFGLFVCIAVAYPVAEQRTLNLEGIVRMRCSLNEADETLFFFNGSVIAYPTAAPAKVLFKTIGVNIARCFKRADGSYTLASREALYYVDPVTDQIVYSWNNTFTNAVVNVVHVDNDPVLQQFPFGTAYPVVTLSESTILPLDIPLFYPNALSFNPAMAPYSPQPNYQAGEFFKFISPTGEVFSDVDTVSTSLVSWTRVGPWLPWMKMGTAPGYLLYTSHGAKIPSWADLPQSLKNDFARIPWYKSAPTCVPDTKSVTSWSFFGANLAGYLSGQQFPKAPEANYTCLNYPTPAPTACRASASLVVTNSWSNGEYNTYKVVLTNLGTKTITSVSVSVVNTEIQGAWNINNQGNNVYSVTLWNPFAVGASLDGPYGFNARDVLGGAVASVASVTCA